MRQWGGIVDTNPDASPIIGKTPVEGIYINCGWGTGGFKATPGSGWVFAHTLACDEPHPLNAPFGLDRFTSGYLIDEHGYGHSNRKSFELVSKTRLDELGISSPDALFAQGVFLQPIEPVLREKYVAMFERVKAGL